MSGKTIRSFNADGEVNELIKEAGIKKGELTAWVNDKIKKGVIYERNPIAIEIKPQEVKNVRVIV